MGLIFVSHGILRIYRKLFNTLIMKILPYIISVISSGLIATILSFPIALIIGRITTWLYNEKLGFWSGLYIAGLEAFLIVIFSRWIFGLFGYSLPIFFIIVITLFLTFNNFMRFQTKSNSSKELGYLAGHLGGIRIIYWQIVSEFDSGFIFW